MKSLFKTAAKKSLVEKIEMDFFSLPKCVQRYHRRYARILKFHQTFQQLPAIPDECFVFAGPLRLNLRETFKRAEKVVDPECIFRYYVELGQLKALRPIWTQLDDQRKGRIYDCGDILTRFFGECLEYSAVAPGYSLLELYRASKGKNVYMSALIYKLGPINFRQRMLLSEFYETLQSMDRRQWFFRCRLLALLVALKDFEINISELGPRYCANLEKVIRTNYSAFLRLPSKCRIPEMEEFATQKRRARELCVHDETERCVDVADYAS
uniref:NR LBD domain-containing protein n=1 Tax=Steinernema glaseri TaxID=37863 RepID=A0A1I7YWT7_9BILA